MPGLNITKRTAANEDMPSPKFKKRLVSRHHNVNSDASNASSDDHVHHDNNHKGTTKQQKKNNLMKPPTYDEIQQLRDTAELYKSNLFKLQFEELLSEVRVNYSRMTTLESMLHKLKHFFESLPSREELGLDEATSSLLSKSVSIPFPSPPPSSDIKYKFAFQKPSKVAIVGSYLLKTLTKGKTAQSVDMAIQIPDAILTDRDYINYRYLYKRAYYLAVIAAELQNVKNEWGVEMKYSLAMDLRKPGLILSFAGLSQTDASSMLEIRIIPCISPTMFQSARLAPLRNSVRTAISPPTPKYNASVLADSAYIAHLNYMHTAVQWCPSLVDACILAKVWLRQRALDAVSFVMSILMTWLVKYGPTGTGVGVTNLSSYQILKLALQFIASDEFITKPWFLTSDSKPLSGVPEFSEEVFTSHFEVVIVDFSGRLNLAAQWAKHVLLEWHHEAKLSMALFNDGAEDKFDSLFLKNVDENMLKFDLIATIPTCPTSLSIPRTDDGSDQPSQYVYVTSHLPNVLRRALGPRLTLVTTRCPPPISNTINEALPTIEARSIHFGIQFDAEASLRAVYLGPDANDQAASAGFCHLWGDKAEIRRFKDSSIKYAAVFEADVGGRSGILPRMIQHLIKRHLGVNATIWSTQLDVVLSGVYEERPTSFVPVMEAFASLSKALRDLENLPLAVVSLIPLAPELRYSSVFVPTTSSPSYNSQMDVIIQLEPSARWPVELEAMHKFKVAFSIRMVELLAEAMPGTTAKVATSSTSQLKEGWVDVTIPPGYTFRLWIQNEQEALVLDRTLANPQLDMKQRDRFESAKLRFNSLYIHRARHAALISNIATRIPSYSSITRLTKRWISAHMLSRCISDEVIELICARVVTESYRGGMWSSPSSHMFGFLRVLWYIACFPWKTDPFIVELSEGGITPDVVNKINQAFEACSSRKSIFVCTEEDVNASWWSSIPNSTVLNRLVGLAHAALKVWGSCVQGSSSEEELLKIFVTPSEGYDMIIRLNPRLLPRYRQSLTCDTRQLPKLKQQYKNLRVLQTIEDDDWDPAERYVEELEELYGDQVAFFHDRYGGDAIGVVFNSLIVTSGKFKVNTAYAVTPFIPLDAKAKREQGNTAKPNHLSMAAEMHRLGSGIVSYIDYRMQK